MCGRGRGYDLKCLQYTVFLLTLSNADVILAAGSSKPWVVHLHIFLSVHHLETLKWKWGWNGDLLVLLL